MSSGIVRNLTISRQTTVVSNHVHPTVPIVNAPGHLSVTLSVPATKVGPAPTIAHEGGGVSGSTIATGTTIFDESRNEIQVVHNEAREEGDEAAVEEMTECVAVDADAAQQQSPEGSKTVTFVSRVTSIEDFAMDTAAGSVVGELAPAPAATSASSTSPPPPTGTS
jgi:hypothetical protein